MLAASLAASLAATVPASAATQPSTATRGSATGPVARVEARSSNLLAVGVVQGDRMTVRLSRVVDNAPVDNAVVAVMLRGTTHPAVAETDGSYSFQSSDLSLPGPASIELLVTLGNTREELKGTLEVTGPTDQSENRNTSRQLGWWVLNFAVCLGFLWLWSRRKSTHT
jgi:hypothetical protein